MSIHFDGMREMSVNTGFERIGEVKADDRDGIRCSTVAIC